MNEITTTLESLRDGIREQNAKARSSARKSLEHVRACGEMLIELKARVPHGSFRNELKQLGIEQRTANNYMRISSNWKHVSTLTYGVRDAIKLLTRADDPPIPPSPRPPSRPQAAVEIEAEVVEPAISNDALFQQGLDSLQQSMPEDEYKDMLEHAMGGEDTAPPPPRAEVKAKTTDSFTTIIHLLPDLTEPQFRELINIIQTRWLR